MSRAPFALSLVACLAACDGPARDPGDVVAKTEPANTPPASTPPAPPADDCAALPRTPCMESTTCTLEHVSTNRYRCRPATAPCETGFAQAGFYGSGDQIPASEAQQRACAARAGCGFVEAQCYCRCRGYGSADTPDGDEAAPCACECGGGAPQTCARA